MKLQQLKYMLSIVDNGLNITAAAEKLYTSQPGVSKQLKLLEEELGLQLFVRKGKSLGGITPAGEQVIGRARMFHTPQPRRANPEGARHLRIHRERPPGLRIGRYSRQR